MKKIISMILSVAVVCLTFGAADAFYFEETAFHAAFADEPVAFSEENVTLEYSAISYNGAERKPAVTVTVGETVLRAGVDYTVRYPDNCTDVGRKAVQVSGIGSVSGSVEAVYIVTPLICTDNPDVEVTVGDCRYNGLPQYPDITVRCGENVIPKENYTVTLSDNTEVSYGSKAKCTLKFRGNCAGERTAEFSILKSAPEDLEIDIVARAGQSVSMDLTSIKPAGAVFGKPVYPEGDFSADDPPKVAFNILKFTLSPTLKRSTVISVPMTNIVDSEDYWLEFYIAPVDTAIPTMVLKPLVKEYDGKPFSASDIIDSGSYVHYNGEVLTGKWEFVMKSSRSLALPCDKTIIPLRFVPDDPQYSDAYGLATASILRKDADDFTATVGKTHIDVGDTLTVTVSGIPDDFDGNISITSDEEDSFSVLSEEKNGDGIAYTLDFPLEDAYRKLNVTLGGSAFYAVKTIALNIKVGDPSDASLTDAPTTERELAELIANAEDGATVKANRMTLVSEELLKAAAAKRLTIEVKANDNITFVLDPANMKSLSALDLTVSGAVVPQVLLDKLGDEELYAFTAFARNDGVSVKLTAETDLPITCLYLYNTSGKLEHIDSVLRNGKTVLFELCGSGKYVLTASRVSHIFRDFDNDCMFTFEDVNWALGLFLRIDGTGTHDQIEKMDFDGDGIVSFNDINVLVQDFIIMMSD